MRRDPRIGLFILAVGIAPALLKKSKPMARYVGDQLIRAGEYLKQGMNETTAEAPPKVAETGPSAAPAAESAAEPAAEAAVEHNEPKKAKKAK